MADISSYLAAIMAAVYGEDVRGSIHDAIEIINDVSEVVLNTGTAVTGPTSSSTGFYKDSFYINTNTMELWKCIGTDSWQSQGVLKGADGADGNGIVSIVKTATVGLVDTYTITYDDGTTTTYDVTNGQNGSKWYKGTAISGTGTSITGFPGVINDFYLNSVDGYVYTCTKTGGAQLPDAAEWDYVMTLTGGGGASITVVDNLSSTSSTDALSANQGRVLKGYVDAKIADPVVKSNGQVLTYDGNNNEWKAATPSSSVSDLDDLSDVSITSPVANQVLKYDGSVWVNDTAPAGGHNMLDNSTIITGINASISEGTSNDDVVSGYGVGVWSNTDTITLMTTVSQGDTEMGTWEADNVWETSGVRTGWLQHAALHGILSAADKDDYEISLVFDVAGGEAISCLAYRIDDAITSSLGGIAIKFNAPIESVTASVGVVIKHNRTKTFTVTR
ncbi:MAG: hypothetical protein IKE92_11250 [Clostridiales bacterium]|nr:hypothetical protein [Clostridiales bacterium]